MGESKCSNCGYFERCWPVSELEAQGVDTIDALLEHFDEERFAEIERAGAVSRTQGSS
jgi:hypothetical protein